MFSSQLVTFRFCSRWQLNLFLVAIAVLGIFVVGETARITIADTLAESNNVEDVSKAAKMDPLNPVFQYRLGLLYGWQEMNGKEAVAHFHQAVALNPRKANYWFALGRACFGVGDRQCADQALENATRFAPAVPRYQWEIASHYLITGRRNESLARFRRFLELRSEDALPTFRVCLHGLGDPGLIWKALLQNMNSPSLQLSFINFLNENGDSEAAYQLWREVADGGSKFSFSAVQPYLERLVATNQFEQAVRVWQDLGRLGAIHRPASSDTENRIFNAGFEDAPLNAGFDWHLQSQQDLASDFADTDCYEGTRCLSLDFTVAGNATYEPVYEVVSVLPNQHYQLTAFVRSADITSDSGPRMRIVDAACSSCLSAESEDTKGTTPWHRISLNFETRERTRAVRVSVWRPISRSFPMDIQGQFWLDSVSLKAVRPEAEIAGTK